MRGRIADKHDETHAQLLADLLDHRDLIFGLGLPQRILARLAAGPAGRSLGPLAGIRQIDDDIVDTGLLNRGKNGPGMVDIPVIVVRDPLVAHLESDNTLVRAAAADQNVRHRDGPFRCGFFFGLARASRAGQRGEKQAKRRQFLHV